MLLFFKKEESSLNTRNPSNNPLSEVFDKAAKIVTKKYASELNRRGAILNTVSPANPVRPPLRIGGILSRAAAIWQRILVPASLLVSVQHLSNAWRIIKTGSYRIPKNAHEGIGFSLIYCGVLLFSILASGMIYYMGNEVIEGSASRFDRAFAAVFPRLFPIVGTAIAMYALIIGGTVLFVVPGMIFLARYAIAIPVCVIEKTTIRESLARSADLTLGHRWLVLGVVLLTSLPGILAVAVSSAVDKVAGHNGYAVVYLISTSMAGAYGATIFTVFYHDLKTARDGGSGRRLVEVF